MAAISLNLTPGDLFRTKQDVYEVAIQDWGTNVNDTYPFTESNDFSATNFPGLPFSPVAIAIGPQSTVDRAWFSWNPMIDPLFFNQSTAVPRIATFESPITFATPGADAVIAKGTTLRQALLKRAIYAFPSNGDIAAFGNATLVGSTGLPQHYLKADGTQEVFFIDGFPDFNQQMVPGLVTPTLHLQFFRKLPAVFPTKRLPLRAALNGLQVFTGADETQIVLPIYGRRHVAVTVGSDAADITWRVATLHAMNFTVVPQEVTQGTVGPLAAGASDKIILDEPCADYLLLYAKKGVAANATVTCSITAID